jgi:hypothetical protein
MRLSAWISFWRRSREVQRSGELEDRLRSSLKQTVPERGQPEQPFYEVVRSPGQVLVVERNKAGEAEIEFTVPAGCTCILWRLPTGLFEFLREDKNADGPFLVQRSDGQFEAHIVECKKTVDQKKWSDITEQMRWTLCKLMALAGALGVQVEEAVLYTAYRFDKLSEHESPNPAAAKRLIGDPDAQSPEEVEYTEARRQQLAWERDQVPLRGFVAAFRHHKIRLDEATGRATQTFQFAL